VRGALAVDTQREPVARARPAAAEAAGYPVGRITTLHPRSFNEARTIGEHYREGTPVIINLTDMEDADARRLVDFAAGLAFALRGDIDRVTNKVFLLSPPNVDVTAEDKRRIAEGGFFAQG
jgi:cell division inhibitor SepF